MRPCRPRGRTPSPNFCLPRARPSCPRPSSTPMACGAPTSSRLHRPCPIWSKARPCWWTGCRGTTLLVATRTLVWRCTTAARSISTKASPPLQALLRRCAICAKSRPPCTSTCPRALNTLPAPWKRTPCCAPACSRRSRCSFTPGPRWRSRCGTACIARRRSNVASVL